MAQDIAGPADSPRIGTYFRRSLDETLGDSRDRRVLHRRKELARHQLGGAGHGPRFEAELDRYARLGLRIERVQEVYGAKYRALREAQWRGHDVTAMTADVERADRDREDVRLDRERSKERLESLARIDYRRRLARPWAPRRIRPVVRCTRGRGQARARRSHRVAKPLKTAGGDSGDDPPAEPPGPGNPHTATIGGVLDPPTESIRDLRGPGGGR